MKKLLSFLLVMVISVTAIIALVPPVEASAAPYLNIEMDYSETVKSGTIRYISQIPTNKYFNSKYWPSSSFGGYTSSWNECGTSCISMALSYIGLNYTPKKILEAHNGYTYFDGWKGATYYTYSASNISTAIDKYLNGNGQYSPVVVHLDYGSTGNGHYIMIVDKVSSNVYKFVDPADSTVREYTINGTSINYKGYSNKIDQVCQWYNKDSIICNCDSFEGLGVCTECGKTYDWQGTFSTAEAGTYKLVKDCTPRTDAPYSDATQASTKLKSGTTVNVLGSYINAYGSKFYKFTYNSGNNEGYAYYTFFELTNYNALDVTCTGFTPSENESLPLGQGYPVWGTVSSNYPLKKVVAKLDGSEYATWTASNDNTTSFAINPTDINNKLKFGSLSAGKHTVTLIATDIHGRTQTFLTRSFNMVSTSCSHSYGSSYKTDANNHWKVCSKCGSSASVEAHVYSNSCDTSCNTCGYTRTITHTYSNDCDASCNVCGATRTAIHSYKRNSNADYHWQECTSCGEKTNFAEHIWIITPFEQHHTFTCGECYYAMILDHEYSNNCDATCNICEETRTPIHTYSNACDTSCNVCGATRVTSHEYDNACDSFCNLCGEERSTNHKYSNACDDSCDVCGETRTVPDHVYDHGCDSSCNNCGYSRPTNHSYDNNCDSDCNTCGAIRSVSHSYTSSYFSDDTTHWRQCSSCGHKGYTENHIPGAPATETNPQRCLACEYVIQPALGHTHSFGDTYYADKYQHWHQCTDESCGVKTDIADHVFGQGEVIKEPTTTEKGEMTYICSVCGERKYEEIDIITGEDDNVDNGVEEKDHSKCLEEASGWKRFWNAIGNFFRRIFSDHVNCVCGDEVKKDAYTEFKNIFKQNRR